MFLRTTYRSYKNKTYTNHLLVESVYTPEGPRQRTVCSLGDLRPRPRTEWLKLLHRVEEALVGQGDWFDGADEEVQAIVAKVKAARGEPVYHQVERRADTHIFLSVLAYHLLVAIEKTLLDQDVHTSWQTVREALKTHQVCTVVLPADSGAVLRIRQGSTPEPQHKQIYRLLDVPKQIMEPKKTGPNPQPPHTIVTKKSPIAPNHRPIPKKSAEVGLRHAGL